MGRCSVVIKYFWSFTEYVTSVSIEPPAAIQLTIYWASFIVILLSPVISPFQIVGLNCNSSNRWKKKEEPFMIIVFTLIEVPLLSAAVIISLNVQSPPTWKIVWNSELIGIPAVIVTGRIPVPVPVLPGNVKFKPPLL